MEGLTGLHAHFLNFCISCKIVVKMSNPYSRRGIKHTLMHIHTLMPIHTHTYTHSCTYTHKLKQNHNLYTSRNLRDKKTPPSIHIRVHSQLVDLKCWLLFIFMHQVAIKNTAYLLKCVFKEALCFCLAATGVLCIEKRVAERL